MINDIGYAQILEFVRKDNCLIDAVILNSLKDRILIEDLLKLNAANLNYFSNLSSFLNSELNPTSFCFINTDENDLIDENTSLRLFRKVRGKVKVIIYNETICHLKNEEFYKYINWMRLLVIG
jgi:hypothetical protein